MRFEQERVCSLSGGGSLSHQHTVLLAKILSHQYSRHDCEHPQAQIHRLTGAENTAAVFQTRPHDFCVNTALGGRDPPAESGGERRRWTGSSDPFVVTSRTVSTATDTGVRAGGVLKVWLVTSLVGGTTGGLLAQGMLGRGTGSSHRPAVVHGLAGIAPTAESHGQLCEIAIECCSDLNYFDI